MDEIDDEKVEFILRIPPVLKQTFNEYALRHPLLLETKNNSSICHKEPNMGKVDFYLQMESPLLLNNQGRLHITVPDIILSEFIYEYNLPKIINDSRHITLAHQDPLILSDPKNIIHRQSEPKILNDESHTYLTVTEGDQGILLDRKEMTSLRKSKPRMVDETEPILEKNEPLILRKIEPMLEKNEPMILNDPESTEMHQSVPILTCNAGTLVHNEPIITANYNKSGLHSTVPVLNLGKSLLTKTVPLLRVGPEMFKHKIPLLLNAIASLQHNAPLLVKGSSTFAHNKPEISKAAPTMVHNLPQFSNNLEEMQMFVHNLPLTKEIETEFRITAPILVE